MTDSAIRGMSGQRRVDLRGGYKHLSAVNFFEGFEPETRLPGSNQPKRGGEKQGDGVTR